MLKTIMLCQNENNLILKIFYLFIYLFSFTMYSVQQEQWQYCIDSHCHCINSDNFWKKELQDQKLSIYSLISYKLQYSKKGRQKFDATKNFIKMCFKCLVLQCSFYTSPIEKWKMPNGNTYLGRKLHSGICFDERLTLKTWWSRFEDQLS